jgi:hypothetical protein
LPRGAVHPERRFCQLRLRPCHPGRQPYPPPTHGMPLLIVHMAATLKGTVITHP